MKQKYKKPALSIALGQIDVQAGRPDINVRRVIDESIAASKRGVQVIIFPEMCISGYLIGDRFNSNGFAEDISAYNRMVVDALAAYDIVVIFGTFAVDMDKVNENGTYRKYNAALVAHKGVLLKNDAGLPYAIKSLLPNYRIFDDARYFHDLRKLVMERGAGLEELLAPFTVEIGGHRYKLGVMLCEDMWDIDYAQKPAEVLKANGAEVLINLSFSNWSWRKNAKRHQVVKDLVTKVALPFVYVNGVGSQNNGKNFIPFDGSSTVYNADGDTVLVCDMYTDSVTDFVLDANASVVIPPVRADVAEMFMAIKADTLGFFRASYPKYRRKVVIGLSGGMDSMLSAAFFVHLLGPKQVVLVNMPMSGFNSQETIGIAQQGADNLGVPLRVVPIDALVAVDAQLHDIQPGTGQHKTLQAAMRFKVLASIASNEGGLIIANANKTEIAFGYGTLIGDMRGYFAPWMDCLKGEVYQLAAYLNDEVFGREVIPQACFDIEPMDELTAGGSGIRKDPFDYGHVNTIGYHDAMVRSLVELRKEPEWFLQSYIDGTLERQMHLPEGRIMQLFPSRDAFVADLEEKLRMFADGVHKRVQSIPGAHFSRSSFGWDFREYLPVVADQSDDGVLQPLYTLRYQALKKKVLG